MTTTSAPRVNLVDPSTASGKTAELFAGVQAKLGAVPNVFRVFANSPAVLQAYLGLSGTLATGTLTPPQREQIALAIGEYNSCEYCLSAHTAIGQKAGLTVDATLAARRGQGTDAKSSALIQLTLAILESRGTPSDAVLATARQAGITDAELVEVIANVALNIFTNYTNHIARTAVDFPPALALKK